MNHVLLAASHADAGVLGAGTCYWSDLNQPVFRILVLGANQQYKQRQPPW